MKTKTFLKNIEDMTERAFDKLYAEHPDFNLYTVFIHVDFTDLKSFEKEPITSRAVCSIGFDDLANSLKCAKIWAESLHPKDESDRNATRTYNPKEFLLKDVEHIECEGVNVRDAAAAIKTYSRCSALIVTANVRAQKFNICDKAAVVIEFEQWWLGRGIYDMVILDKEKSNFDIWWKIICASIVLFTAYKLLF
ncbi:MAG: hypothetical protein LBP40_07925 [Campylobacteraceae bacterium]|nr:hypothetical protein [Campylobacteraceae bacterium]